MVFAKFAYVLLYIRAKRMAHRFVLSLIPEVTRHCCAVWTSLTSPLSFVSVVRLLHALPSSISPIWTLNLVSRSYFRFRPLFISPLLCRAFAVLFSLDSLSFFLLDYTPPFSSAVHQNARIWTRLMWFLWLDPQNAIQYRVIFSLSQKYSSHKSNDIVSRNFVTLHLNHFLRFVTLINKRRAKSYFTPSVLGVTPISPTSRFGVCRRIALNDKASALCVGQTQQTYCVISTCSAQDIVRVTINNV